MNRPALEEFLRLAGEGSSVPVHITCPGDVVTPVAAYRRLVPPGGAGFLLESTERSGRVGRYTFLGLDPGLAIMSRGREIVVSENGRNRSFEGNPVEHLRTFVDRSRVALPEGLPSIVGGLVGYAGYDMVRHIERLPDRHAPGGDGWEMRFVRYDSLVIFDHLKKRMIVTRIIDDPSEETYTEGMAKLEFMRDRLFSPDGPPESGPPRNPDPPSWDMTDEEYAAAVRSAREQIAAGEIFQVVLSRTCFVPLDVVPFDLYRALRMVNPSPYMFFLESDDSVVLGSSPERLVRVADGEMETRPIAGTRPRGSGAMDRDAERDLLNDPKEMAEHMMLVDLARNDIGRLARPGTVRVEELAEVERYSHVMHLTSRVKGSLADGMGPVDALFSCMPAGTLSGAPKVRAMEIIDELERSRRGIYGGAVGYFGSRGDLDTCIAIRMAVVEGSTITVRSGAGIVWDSDPKREARETRDKAACILEALKLAREELS